MYRSVCDERTLACKPLPNCPGLRGGRAHLARALASVVSYARLTRTGIWDPFAKCARTHSLLGPDCTAQCVHVSLPCHQKCSHTCSHVLSCLVIQKILFTHGHVCLTSPKCTHSSAPVSQVYKGHAWDCRLPSLIVIVYVKLFFNVLCMSSLECF